MTLPKLINILVHFAAFAAYAGLIGFVLNKNPRELLNRLCALILALLALWTLGEALSHCASSADRAIWWINVSSPGWCTFPVPALWFYLAFTGHEKPLKNRLFIVAGVLPALFFLYLQWTGRLIYDVAVESYGWRQLWASATIQFAFAAYYILFTTLCIYLAFDFGKRAKNHRERRQAQIFFVTPIIALVLGTITDIILPAMEIGVVPQAACVVILIWGAGLVYAVSRYGFMTLTPAAAADDILETMEDSVIMIDMEGKIISANRSSLELLGYAPQELGGKRFDSIAAGGKARSESIFEEILTQSRIASREGAFLAKDGEKIPVLFSASIVKDRYGEPAGIVVTAHDMREYKEMEFRLRKSEERYRTLVDHALVGIGIHQDGRVVFANEHLANMLGYPLEEHIGDPIKERIHPEDRDFVLERASRRLEGYDEPVTYEIRLLKSDGAIMHALISNALIEYEGQSATLITVADVTDTKARMELEQINKELEAFSYSVSHDLRAPLRAIDGFSLALFEDYEDTLDETGKDYLHRLRAACGRMDRLIDDLLALSRVGRVEMHYGPVDLTALAETVAAELKEAEPSRSVEFLIEEGMTAYGDKNLLMIVLENLIGNAWKFTKNQPGAVIEIGEERREGRPVYFVRDNGAGFDATYVYKLFVPFQRLHGAEFEGTGIGLATVKRIIHRHDGSIWAEGEVDKGAVFYFTLKS